MSDGLRVQVARVHGRLDAGMGNARAQWRERQAWLLKLSWGDGVGLGEVSPLPGYSQETLAEVEQSLRGVLPLLRGLKLAPIASLLSALPQQPDPLASLHQTLGSLLGPGPLPPSVRCGLETGLLSLLAAASQRSLYTLLSSCLKPLPTSAAGKLPLETCHLVDVLEAEAVARHLALARATGCTALKVKVGRPGQEAAERGLVERLASEWPGALRLDLNRMLDRAAADRWGALAESVGLTWLEEPTPLSWAPPLPTWWQRVALDESLQQATLEEVQRLRAHPAGALVLKPMALGGPVRCLQLARVAMDAGMAGVVSHLIGGPAALRLEVALEGVIRDGRPERHPLAAGLECHPGLSAWPALDRASFDALLIPDVGPGLGLPARWLEHFRWEDV